MSYQLNRHQYARIYGTTARSVGNYERDEAPLDDPEAMYHWLWKRRTQPAGFSGKSIEEIVDDYKAIAENDGQLMVWRELSDHFVEIDLDRWRMCHWVKTNSHRLPAGVPERLERLSANILAEMAKLNDLPSGYPDLDEDFAEEPAANIVHLPVRPTSDTRRRAERIS